MILIFNILPISSSTNLYNIIGGTKLLPFFIDKKTLAKYIFHNRHPINHHITFVYFILSKILGRYASLTDFPLSTEYSDLYIQ